MNLIQKVEKTIKENGLFKKGDKVVVAVSGGPDSVCLLDILVKLKEKLGVELIVAHLNHNLRGEESLKDEEFTKNLALKYGLSFYSQKIKEKPKGNLEEWARNLRYQFLAKVAKQNKTDLVCTAHTADDQIETVLINALRGAGPAGICGMNYKTQMSFLNFKIWVVRPLLDVWRQEIENYLTENNLNFRIDKTNFDLRFLRNKIRHQLIPALLKENPAFKEHFLSNIKKHQKKYEQFLEKINTLFEKIVLKKTPYKIKLSAENFEKLSFLEQGEIIRQAIKILKGNTLGFEKIHLQEIIDVFKKKIPGKKKIFKGLVFENQKDGFIIYKLKSQK